MTCFPKIRLSHLQLPEIYRADICYAVAKAPTFDVGNSCEAPDAPGPEREKCKSGTRDEGRKCERTTLPPISAYDDHSYQLIRWRAAMMDCMVDTLNS